MKFLALITFLTASMFVLSSCHTVEGVGQDVEAAGDAVEDSARESRGY